MTELRNTTQAKMYCKFKSKPKQVENFPLSLYLLEEVLGLTNLLRNELQLDLVRNSLNIDSTGRSIGSSQDRNVFGSNISRAPSRNRYCKACDRVRPTSDGLSLVERVEHRRG